MNIIINDDELEATIQHSCSVEDILKSIPMDYITDYVNNKLSPKKIIDAFEIEPFDFGESDYKGFSPHHKKKIICYILEVDTSSKFKDVVEDIESIFENIL